MRAAAPQAATNPKMLEAVSWWAALWLGEGEGVPEPEVEAVPEEELAVLEPEAEPVEDGLTLEVGAGAAGKARQALSEDISIETQSSETYFRRA